MSDGIRVVVTDDHAIVRDGLRLIIEGQARMSVVAEAADVAGALEHMREHKPDVMVLDINLAGESGLDAMPALREESPKTAIVVLTMQNDAVYARMALEAGAAGYVVKDSAAHELVRAITAAAAGQTYLQPELGGLLVQEKFGAQDEPLSERELQVLRLIALGHTNAEVSEQLYLSVRTVESHRARIQEKLGISGRAELVRHALEHGLIER